MKRLPKERSPLPEEKVLELTGDNPGEETAELLGTIPGRWGRMPVLSRLVLVETGRVLRRCGLLQDGNRQCDRGLNVGLVGASRRGSLHTDLAFQESMASGPALASPALFGYTLPNTPLAEAAVQFGLSGPVYAVFDDSTDIMAAAEKEAACLLEQMEEVDFMLACAFDHYPADEGREVLSVNLMVLQRDGDGNPGISEVAENP